MLVREEIELAKAEVTEKVTSLGRGAAAVAVGAVFGVFALVFVLLTIAWGLELASPAASGSASLIVMVVLLVLTVFAFLFAWRKLKVGAPTPTMAIDEAKKIRATVKPGRRRLMATRSPEEIRASIEANRRELGTARGEAAGRGRRADRLALPAAPVRAAGADRRRRGRVRARRRDRRASAR